MTLDYITPGAVLSLPPRRLKGGHARQYPFIAQWGGTATDPDTGDVVVLDPAQSYDWHGKVVGPQRLRTPALYHVGSFKSLLGLDPEDPDADLTNADGSTRGRYWKIRSAEQVRLGLDDPDSVTRCPRVVLGQWNFVINGTPDNDFTLWEALAAELEGRLPHPLLLLVTGQAGYSNPRSEFFTPAAPGQLFDEMPWVPAGPDGLPAWEWVKGGHVLCFGSEGLTSHYHVLPHTAGVPATLDKGELAAAVAYRQAALARFGRLRTVVFVEYSAGAGESFFTVLPTIQAHLLYTYPGWQSVWDQVAAALAPLNVVFKWKYNTNEQDYTQAPSVVAGLTPLLVPLMVREVVDFFSE